MKKKKLLQFISLMLSLVFVHSMTAFAETGEHVHSDVCQHRVVDDIDEYLAQLNEGLIIPRNTTITTFDSVAEVDESYISPMSWPWTDCSNILGHSWGNWGSWSEVGDRVHYPNGDHCIAHIERWRFCERTHCNASEVEQDVIWVKCCN